MSFTVMRSILIPSGQKKAAAFPCPFRIPVAMSLGWLLCMRKVIESQREFCTWKGFSHEMQPALAGLSELQRNNGYIAYLMNKWYSKYDILWVFWILAGILAVLVFGLGGNALVSVQLGVYTYEKENCSKQNNSGFWPSWWKSQTGWKIVWFL